MKKVSYASTANDDNVSKVKPETHIADAKPIEYMDVTALMNMLDKNRSQQPESDGDTIVLEPQQENKPASSNATAEVKELLLDLPKQTAPKNSAEDISGETTPKKKKSSGRGVSDPAKSKKKSSAKPETEAEDKDSEPKDKKNAEKNAEADAQKDKDLPVPASVAVSRLQVERNSSRASREMQVKTLRNSRRSSPMGDAIAPVEYATLATLTAVAVAVLVAIFYLVNDKGEIQPAVTSTRVPQTVVHDKNVPNTTASTPQETSQGAMEKELLNILNK